jgi:drug/metabolite transporter (DMT)-like permease
LYVGTAASVLAYWLWNRGVMTLGAARSAPFINLLPVFTVLLSVVLLHEKVDVGELIGGALTVAGAVLAGIQRSHAAASTPQSAQRLP